ncbi:hypothetical protein Mpal_1908 [Methanosphaerula palustris E1-9c]|uniref:Yip1 domain-containing protein n=2 Tax=Methanosphaerula palustris TaxID=475088 RepID=B8GKR7_METPE|nr:hypothetical protein Mpal_1908 [Methanosphaerula palustris E1-9c]
MPTSEALVYYLQVVMAYAFLTTVVGLLTGTALFSSGAAQTPPYAVVLYFFGLLLGSCAWALFLGITVHLTSRALGGSGSMKETLSACLLSFTPLMVTGWIPLIGSYIADIWSLSLFVIGIREVHALSTRRAVLAVVLPLALLFTLLVLTFIYLIPTL